MSPAVLARHALRMLFSGPRHDNERASYNGSIEASQASDVGSIPIARSISHISIALTRLTYLNPA